MKQIPSGAGCIIAVILSMCSCASGPARAHTRAYERVVSWPQRPYAEVTGYSFKGPEMAGVLTKNGIDVERLRQFTVVKASLSQTQSDQLLGAIRMPKETFPEMMCYEPHHVFVFCSENNEAVAAIEVCFTCNSIRTWPDAGMVRLRSGLRCDLPTLARLANELGLGLGAPAMTLPRYLQGLKEQQAEHARISGELTGTRS